MIMTGPPYTEMVVKVVPSRSTRSGAMPSTPYEVSSGEPARSYDALLYTDQPLPGLVRPDRLPPDQPPAIAQLTLAAVEHLVVFWNRYQEYLAAFVEGAKDPYRMRSLLLRVMSPGLEMLFNGQLLADRSVRVWWSSETPELEDLPWELVAYASRQPLGFDFSFVRGLPPDMPAPLLPISDRLRLALVHDPIATPQALLNTLMGLPSVEVVSMAGPPREALRRACAEGFELVHIVADGILTLAYEGVLYLHDPSAPLLSPGELSALLRGSRVTVLSLSASQIGSPDMMPIGGELVPSAYRAFALLGASPHPLPTIAAPLGPFRDWELAPFWQGFYTGLSETLEVEQAMARGRANAGPLALALFLRQRHRRTFRRLAPQHQRPQTDPTQIEAELQRSRDLVNQLHAIDSQVGPLPAGVSEFLERESARQNRLSSELNPWVELEAGER